MREAELQHVRKAEVQLVREVVQHVREAVCAAPVRLRRSRLRSGSDAGAGSGSGSLRSLFFGDRTAAASKDACRARPVPVLFALVSQA